MNFIVYNSEYSEEVVILPLQTEQEDWFDWIEQASILELYSVYNKVPDVTNQLIKAKLEYYGKPT